MTSFFFIWPGRRRKQNHRGKKKEEIKMNFNCAQTSSPVLIALVLLLSTINKCNAQQSSVQVEKIEMFPVEPRPGESVRLRCYLKNVDPTKKIKPSIIWSIREPNTIYKESWRIIGNGASITDTFNNRLSGRKESDEVWIKYQKINNCWNILLFIESINNLKSLTSVHGKWSRNTFQIQILTYEIHFQDEVNSIGLGIRTE